MKDVVASEESEVEVKRSAWIMSAKSLEIRAMAFISSQNHPMLVRTFKGREEDELKFHYVAHTALDVIEERLTSAKSMDCFLGLLYVMEDASVAVYGYQTPSRVKLVLAIAQADTFIRDADIIMIFKAMHMAYQRTLCNPFLRLHSSCDHSTEQIAHLMFTGDKWESLKMHLDTIAKVALSDAIE